MRGPAILGLFGILAAHGTFAAPTAVAGTPGERLPPALRPHLVCAYDFDHPSPDDSTVELDQGVSGTSIHLVNGGPAMRVPDGARPGGGDTLQTQARRPAATGRDDWKAGVFSAHGVPSLAAFASAQGITLAGWVKSTAPAVRPALNTQTPAPDDRHPSICLFGLLHGRSDGHPVRALIEFIHIEGRLRLVALGRRLDEGPALVLAATAPPDVLLPPDTWVHLTATFDFASGAVRLYRDGEPLEAEITTPGDPWALAGIEAGAARSSATVPVGIKIGGSYPQNTRERNPFEGRFDDLFFFDRALSPEEARSVFAGPGQLVLP